MVPFTVWLWCGFLPFLEAHFFLKAHQLFLLFLFLSGLWWLLLLIFMGRMSLERNLLVSHFRFQRGSPLCKVLGAEEIGLFWLVDFYWGYLISHWLAILLIMVGFPTKPNAETEVCQWIMIWCWFLLTKINKTYIVQDRWGLLVDEKRESLGAVNCDTLTSIFFRDKSFICPLKTKCN